MRPLVLVHVNVLGPSLDNPRTASLLALPPPADDFARQPTKAVRPMTRMSRAHLRPATAEDRHAVVALVESQDLSGEGIDPSLEGFVVAEDAGRLVGVAGLERYGDFGLLRSVAVAGDRRGEGLGARLTAAVIDEARRRGLSAVYALTTTAMTYFPRLGFVVIDRTRVPDVVRASDEFTTMCPATASALELRLMAES